ncbi:MAG: ComEC/Rec2 family competence protein, partial [Eubacterium sp.]|nr:ComEC/Rec2 family competence protein [Eubacterium sp.]
MRRPLCVVLVALIICIIIFYKPDKSFDNSIDQKIITLYACVDEILGTPEINAIIVKDVVRYDGDGTFFCEKLKVYPGKSFSGDKLTLSDIGIGNIVRLTGNVVSPERPGNPGQFDEQVYYRSQGLDASLFLQKYEVTDDKEDGIAMLLYRARCFLAGAFAAVVPEREAGILSAMLLGEKSGLDDEVRELYTETGIAHILAISGLHISMIGMGLFAFLRRFVMPMRWAVIVTGIMLFLYGMLTGFSIATRRAVIMTMLVLIARLIGERYDRINALALAAIVELLIHPASLFLPGFLLSYGTVAGIALFVDELKGIMSGDDRSICYKLFTVVSGSVGVTVVTLPIMVQCYHEIPVFSVVVNIILLPLMTYILATAVLGGVIACISSFISGFILGTSYYILRLYQLVCDIVTAIPLHRIIVGHRSAVSIAIYYVVIFLIVLIFRRVKQYKNSGRRTGKNTAEKRTKMCIVSVGILVLDIVIFILPITSG